MSRLIVIYHSADLDGHCSGALVALAFQQTSTIEFIGWNHGEPIPQLVIDRNTSIFVVDLAFPLAVMLDWRERAGGLIWLDHHSSAISELEAEGFAGFRDIKKAACELVWEYCFPEQPMPTAVRLLGRYDVWDHAADHRVLPFQYAMRAERTNPDDGTAIMDYWQRLVDEDVGELARLVERGESMQEYEDASNATAARLSAFEVQFGGLPAICMTRCKGGSLAFKSVYRPSKHKLMIACFFTGSVWDYSLYSDHADVDCGAICKQLGGGGHKGAAGFRSDDFLLEP